MQLSPSDRRRIATVSIFGASVIAAIGFALVAFLFVIGATKVALGILCGHGVAVLCGLTWIVGAVATFDSSFGRFAKATIGFSPIRLVLVAGVTMAVGWFARDHVDLTALGLSFVATEFLLQILQGWCFMKLADATSPYQKRTPVRIGGVSLGGNVDANFGGANVGGANLGGANLGGAKLEGTTLKGLTLRGLRFGKLTFGGLVFRLRGTRRDERRSS